MPLLDSALLAARAWAHPARHRLQSDGSQWAPGQSGGVPGSELPAHHHPRAEAVSGEGSRRSLEVLAIATACPAVVTRSERYGTWYYRSRATDGDLHEIGTFLRRCAAHGPATGPFDADRRLIRTGHAGARPGRPR